MSTRLIANWKMNGSSDFNQNWTLKFLENFNVQNFSFIGIAPPYIYINEIKKILGNYGIQIGSQNIDTENIGPRTGEISASMIKDLGCKFSIIGHSERRIIFNESNQIIHQKLIQANKNSILPVLCIGESAEENKKGFTNKVLKDQIYSALNDSEEINTLIIAYEPIWAIGTGIMPNPEDINSVHEFIKDVVQSRFPKTNLKSVLYGGSVDLSNAPLLFEQQSIDGALIGGASLDGKEFALIANIFNNLKG